MTNERYKLLMGEMCNIAEKVKLFPDHLQEDVFGALLGALVDRQESKLQSKSAEANEPVIRVPTKNEEVAHETVEQVWNGTGEVVKLVNKHSLKDMSSIDLAALVAYVHIVFAPDHSKLETINMSHFEDVCVELGRDIGNSKAALDNAKKAKYKFLQGGKKDGYKITNKGIIHVETKLLQAKS